MCVDPCKLPSGEQVACRYCWQCKANRVNDLVGRCIAEQTSSAASYAVTLTYAGNGPETAMLRYRDIQLMLKLIRRKGYAVRYIVAGEFGTKKGRAHWHAVLFFSCIGPTGPMPIPRIGNGPWDIRIGERFNWHPWPHGFAFFQQPDYGGFAYVLKYALKDQDQDVSKGHLAMSKKPPLGHEFFMARAAQYVEQGLAPQDLFYSFGNVFDAKRKRRRFLIQGVTRQNFLTEFETRWRELYGSEPPLSEALTAHWDKLAREEMAATRTDQQWRAAKDQWPKYVRADEGGMLLPDKAVEVTAAWPVGLYDIMPAHVPQEVINGDAVDIRIEWLGGGNTLHISIGEMGWLASDGDAERVEEWLHQVHPQSEPDLMLW